MDRLLLRETVGVMAGDQLNVAYELSEAVSLRPERFGALAYHFHTRKLSFLKHPDLVRVVESFDGATPLRDVLINVGVDEARWPSFCRALSTLETSEMICADSAGTTTDR